MSDMKILFQWYFSYGYSFVNDLTYMDIVYLLQNNFIFQCECTSCFLKASCDVQAGKGNFLF